VAPPRASIRLVVLDFDGTLSDAEAEAVPFVEAFRSELFDLIGRDASEAWARHEQAIRQRPAEHGWRYRDRIAAPAGADPYLLTASIAQRLCDELGIMQQGSLRSEVLELLYRRAYPLTRIVPRPNARALLEALTAAGVAVYVITNSRTDAVQRKLDAVGAKGREVIRVIGDARKFVLDDGPRDDRFDALEELALPGLDQRRVASKRGHYYDALCRAWQESGTTAEETLVCGDIFELDLALPLALGCHVHLIHGDDTPAYELAYVRAQPRGGASRELSRVVERLEG
jgi:FMN phosphatase YigB (HAD superfamily)